MFLLLSLFLVGCGQKEQNNRKVISSSIENENVDASNVMSKTVEFDGSLYVDSGLVIKNPSKQEAEQYINNSEVSNPLYPLKVVEKTNDVLEETVLSNKTIQINYNGVISEITLSYYKKNGQQIFLTDNRSNYHLTKRNQNQYILEWAENLFNLDVSTWQVSQVLSDEVGVYKRLDLLKVKKEEQILQWGTIPCINQAGDIIAFNSNRGYFYSEDRNASGEIWVKNFNNSEEKLIDSSGLIMGWINDDLFLKSPDQVISVNIITGISHVVVPDLSPLESVVLVDDSLIKYDNNRIYLINPFDLSQKIIWSGNSGGNIANVIINSKKEIAVLFQQNRTESRNKLILVNSVTGEIKDTPVSDDGFIIYSVSWLDDGSLIAVTEDVLSQNPKSYWIET
ncbi:hypothetical protein [Cohnella abietis]|uniref:hypothetical protein n=1 Tax=Cohnella abietis TaxID=2507935 RepID=UPI0013904C0E|nr:hypothetical protein [Cohnella abietis]